MGMRVSCPSVNGYSFSDMSSAVSSACDSARNFDTQSAWRTGGQIATGITQGMQKILASTTGLAIADDPSKACNRYDQQYLVGLSTFAGLAGGVMTHAAVTGAVLPAVTTLAGATASAAVATPVVVGGTCIGAIMVASATASYLISSGSAVKSLDLDDQTVSKEERINQEFLNKLKKELTNIGQQAVAAEDGFQIQPKILIGIASTQVLWDMANGPIAALGLAIACNAPALIADIGSAMAIMGTIPAAAITALLLVGTAIDMGIASNSSSGEGYLTKKIDKDAPIAGARVIASDFRGISSQRAWHVMTTLKGMHDLDATKFSQLTSADNNQQLVDAILQGFAGDSETVLSSLYELHKHTQESWMPEEVKKVARAVITEGIAKLLEKNSEKSTEIKSSKAISEYCNELSGMVDLASKPVTWDEWAAPIEAVLLDVFCPILDIVLTSDPLLKMPPDKVETKPDERLGLAEYLKAVAADRDGETFDV